MGKIKYLQMSGYTSGLIGLYHNRFKKWYGGITVTRHFLNECLFTLADYSASITARFENNAKSYLDFEQKMMRIHQLLEN